MTRSTFNVSAMPKNALLFGSSYLTLFTAVCCGDSKLAMFVKTLFALLVVSGLGTRVTRIQEDRASL